MKEAAVTTSPYFLHSGLNGLPEHGRYVYHLRQHQLGIVSIGLSSKGICAIDLCDSAELARSGFIAKHPLATEANERNAIVERVVDAMLSLQTSIEDLPLDLSPCTEFQAMVWTMLQSIPFGQTKSYAQLAQDIGRPHASRAVGTACGANKLAVLIPCHRVLRADGALGGYRWGLERKARLLQLEQGVLGQSVSICE